MTRELREEARRREEERADTVRRHERFIRDLRTVSATAEGGRILRWLIDQGGVFSEDYQPGVNGAYRAGQRATALALLRLLRQHLSEADYLRIAFASHRSPAADAAGDGDDSPP